MITVTALIPDDWPRWRELRLAALADAPYAFASRLADWQGEHDRPERWRGVLELPGSHNLVAELDGVPAGQCRGGLGETAGTAGLFSMWVAPAARGRGVADRLIAEIEGWAVRADAHELELGVTEGNAAAIALYRRHGFHDTGRRESLPDGVRAELVMSKPLTASR